VPLDAPRGVRPDELARWVARRLEELDPPVDLAGHSLGALVAARVAAARPELVRRLVLIAPPGVRRRPAAAYAWPLARTVVASHPRLLARLTRDALRAGPRNLLRGSLHAAGADISRELPAVTAPTLLVWGARDRLVPVLDAAAWHELLPDARLVVLPRASHVPMVESPEELVDALVAFREELLDERCDDGRA
jgi:pimeloyl-ACP methyl ester carboxylesterase